MARPLEETGLSVVQLNIVDRGRPVWSAISVPEITITPDGITDGKGLEDRHFGTTRPLRRSESNEQLAGTEVSHERHLSIASAQNMRDIAKGLELPIDQIEEVTDQSIEFFMGPLLAVNVLLDTSYHDINETLSPGCVLAFGENEVSISGLVRVTEYNPPCRQPAAPLLHELGRLGVNNLGLTQAALGEKFTEVAANKRGWVGSAWSVLGTVSIDQMVFLQNPLLPPTGF